VEAVAALAAVKNDLDSVLETLTDAEWNTPSACAGWRVRDVVAHIAANAREAIDPLPGSPDDPPPATVRERLHDQRVDRRRSWTVSQVLDEYHAYSAMAMTRAADLQREPVASQLHEAPGLGTYPMHAFTNASVFDYYCHLRIDILRPGGPLERTLPAVAHETLYAAIQWMMWGLPQMQGDELAGSLLESVTLSLTGPGESQWTVTRADTGGALLVSESASGQQTVVSSAHDFVSWGTKRTDWRGSCRVLGNRDAVTPFLDTLNII
jgi:uncharacterized protein (TIGR03083 family)